ncbi:ATP-binding protein, partial [Streptomyces cuspidosporus]|uniref:ATP-binding protein n=1 Tax=Streptomyces cuspidosporus TaxID=66882 RepID=UPI0031FC7890
MVGAAGEQGGRGWDGVPGRLDIVIPAESWLLGVLRRAVAVWLSSAGRPQDDAEPLLFAIGEIVGNSIDHAHPGETIGRISVTVVCERGADRPWTHPDRHRCTAWSPTRRARHHVSGHDEAGPPWAVTQGGPPGP